MTLTYEKILFGVGGTFTAFCIFSVLFGDTAALWLARIAVIGVLIAVVAYAVTHAAGIIKGSVKYREREARKAELELKKLEAEATRAARENGVAVHRLHGPGMMLAVDHSGATPQISSYGYHPEPDHRPELPLNYQPEPETPEQHEGFTPDLINNITELDCLMVWGGRGAGKTNFLQWLALEKSRQGEQLIIIDPKPSKAGKWPGNARIVGHGHNYSEIEMIAQFYQDELETRKATFPDVGERITIVIDELYLLNLKIKGFMDMVLPALLEGREYNIHLILISQSKTAGSMGLKGRYDLLECFDAMVGLKRQGPKNDPRSYSALVDFGEGDEPHRPPVKFIPGASRQPRHDTPPRHSDTPLNPHDTGHGSEYGTYGGCGNRGSMAGIPFDPDAGKYVYEPPEPRRFFESADHKLMVDLFLAGESFNGICRKVLKKTPAGRHTKKIKAVLKQYGVL